MPYAPATQFDPRLITAMGENFTHPLAQGLENFTQTLNEGKAADALRTAVYGPKDENGNYQNPAPFGISDDQWKTMGSRARAAAAHGWMQSTILQKAMAETQHLQEEGQANQFYANLGKSLSKQLDSVPTDDLTGEPMTSDPAVAQLKANITPQQQMLLRAVGEAGPGNRGAAAAVAPIVKAMLGGESAGGTPTLNFGEDPTTGARFATYGKDILSSGINPSKVPKQAQQVTDADGNVLGNIVPNGKGGFMVQSVKANGAVTDQDRFKFATQANLARLKAAQQAVNNPFVSSNPDSLAGAKAELQAAQQEQAQLLATHPSVKAGKGKDTKAPAKAEIPQDFIQYLQKHPESAKSFDAKFGEGASDEYLP